MIRVINGDLMNAKEDIIAHQSNCKGVIDSDIANQLNDKYENFYKYYSEFCEEKCLGRCQLIKVNNNRHIKYIANLFGQDNYGKYKQYTEYDKLRNALIELKEFAKLKNLSIALPYKIGCQTAGGDWDIVYTMLENIFLDYDITLYRL